MIRIIFLVLSLPCFLMGESIAEKLLHSMTMDQKIGQLIIMGTPADPSLHQIKKVEKYLEHYNLGGVLYQGKGDPLSIYQQNQRYSQSSALPLFYAIDAENGLAFRMDSVWPLPKNMSLGAIQQHDLLFEVGEAIGEQCRSIGINFAFAPVIDVNSNPNNPIIHQRSFGENATKVALFGEQVMKGIQSKGVLACAKHFPGHGDTDVDSHLDLPILMHSTEQLMAVELIPFKHLAKTGVSSVMTAHIYLPLLDDRPNRSASLSYPIIQRLLKEECQFKGLIVTDALEMKAITKHFEAGEAVVQAFHAGNDLILVPPDIPMAIHRFRQAVLEGEIDRRELDRRVLKILDFKMKLPTQNWDKTVLLETLNSDRLKALRKKLWQQIITLVKLNKPLVPISRTRLKSVAFVSIGDYSNSPLVKGVKALGIKDFKIEMHATSEAYQELINRLKPFDTVYLNIMELTPYKTTHFGFSSDSIEFIQKIAKTHSTCLTLFATPYSLSKIPSLDAIIVGYEEDLQAQQAVLDLLLGNSQPYGRLPVTASKEFPQGAFSLL